MGRPPTSSGGDATGLALISTAVAQMVVPVVVGVWLDDRNGWSPWGAVVGAVVGFAALVWTSQKQARGGGKPPSDE